MNTGSEECACLTFMVRVEIAGFRGFEAHLHTHTNSPGALRATYTATGAPVLYANGWYADDGGLPRPFIMKHAALI